MHLYDRAGDKGIELSTSGAFIIYCDQMFLQFLFLDFLNIYSWLDVSAISLSFVNFEMYVCLCHV